MTHQHGLVYEFKTCHQCRVEYIRRCRPSLRVQERGFYYLGRFHQADRTQIIEDLKNAPSN